MFDPVAAIGSVIERELTRRGASASEARSRRVEIRGSLERRATAVRQRRPLWQGRRLVAVGPGRLELRALDVLGPAAGQITVAVEVSAISPGTERAQWLRLPNARPAFPYTPGYSGVGRVLAVGEGGAVSVGDRVALLGVGHQSIETISADRAIPVPPSVGDEAAALTYLAVIAGHGLDVAGPVRDQRVVVVGLGTIGALALRMAGTQLPASLVGVAATSRRREATLAHGATDFVTADVDPSGLEADIVIEATGDPDALEWATSAAVNGGAVGVLGSPRGTAPFPAAEVRRRAVRVVGAHISNVPALSKRRGTDLFADLSRRYLNSLAAGSIDVDDLVGQRFDPRELTIAYRRLAAGDLAAAQLDWSMLQSDERYRRISPLSMTRRVPHDRGDAAPPSSSEPVADPSARQAISVSERRALRFAVIGCGDIGVSDARAIDAAEHATVAICHDVVGESAAALGDAIGCRWTDSIEAALDPRLVDAVVIATPHHQHEPVAALAAARGLHAVVEKPLAHDLASARRMVHTAAAADTALTVCFPYRYADGVSAIRRLIDAGALGRIRGASVVFHADKPDSYWFGGFSGRTTTDWRQQHEQSGGGVLIMNLTHYVDLIMHLSGAGPEAVHAVLLPSRHPGIEEGISVSFTLDDGAVCSLIGSAATRGTPSNVFRLWGEHGTVELEPAPTVYSDRVVDGVTTGAWTHLQPGDEQAARRTFFERFADAVDQSRTPDVSAADALAVQELVEAAYRSAGASMPESASP